MPKISPPLALFLLSPAIGELLSGSAPPLEFFNPAALILLASLYGSGAIVVRELKIRWKKDFRALLLLGVAYGILEEGLMVKSFFDPEWMDLGILGSFGRWLDVNWIWTEMLIIYHAVFSITIPIVLVELVYPKRKNEQWVSNRTLIAFTALLASVTAFGFLYLTAYRPPMPQYLSVMIAMSLFAYAAYKLPERKGTERIGKAKTLFVVGSASSTAFFLLFWAGPHIIDNPIIIMLLGMVLTFGITRFLNHFDWKDSSSATNRLAVVAGALSFLIILAFLQESNPTARGMSLVGLASIILLLLLKRRIKTRG